MELIQVPPIFEEVVIKGKAQIWMSFMSSGLLGCIRRIMPSSWRLALSARIEAREELRGFLTCGQKMD